MKGVPGLVENGGESRGALLPAPLTVLHALAPGEYGGAESVIRMLTLGHRNRGHRVVVAATLESADGPAFPPWLDRLAAGGVEIERIVVPRWGYLQERRTLRSLVRRVKPDVVHTHGYRADLLAGSVARSLGVALVTTVHGFTGGNRKNRFYEWLQERAFRRFQAVAAVSREIAERVRRGGVDTGRIWVVPNAWSPIPFDSRNDARAELGIADAAKVIGWVGRLSREKGLDVLLEALPYLMDLPIEVSVLGEGPERAALVTQTQQLGLTNRIRWHGSVREAARLFRAFDCFVLSSRTEGTPIVLLEAMAAEVPAVATTVGGVPDMLSEAECLLVKPEQPAALAEAIRRWLLDPIGAQERASAASRKVASVYALAPWLERYEALYRAAVASPLPSRSMRSR